MIIPSYRESETLSDLLPSLKAQLSSDDEIIVVEALQENQPNYPLNDEILFFLAKKNRAFQMNLGFEKSSGEVVYFVHADTIPPDGFRKDIAKAVKNNYQYGCYPFRFDSNKWYLKINASTTQFNFLFFRGGDQSLFVTRKFFQKLNGFNAYFSVMEEYDFFQRARKFEPIHIIKHKRIKVSARKYEINSYWKVNIANFLAVLMFKRGIHPDVIKKRYSTFLKQKEKRY